MKFSFGEKFTANQKFINEIFNSHAKLISKLNLYVYLIF